jgi:hypothetical protein
MVTDSLVKFVRGPGHRPSRKSVRTESTQREMFGRDFIRIIWRARFS